MFVENYTLLQDWQDITIQLTTQEDDEEPWSVETVANYFQEWLERDGVEPTQLQRKEDI
jgi:hypothetical protein